MLLTFMQITDFGVPSLSLWILAWVFLIIGIITLAILIIYTRYGREVSIKLSVISIAIASILLGFAIHFFLLNFGI
ncbi:MAG: hypothetical protein P8Y23_05445 [Candidatus Lokiarchaeota archaeon]|jgi:hypothetical protein